MFSFTCNHGLTLDHGAWAHQINDVCSKPYKVCLTVTMTTANTVLFVGGAGTRKSRTEVTRLQQSAFSSHAG